MGGCEYVCCCFCQKDTRRSYWCCQDLARNSLFCCLVYLPSFYQFCFLVTDPVQFLAAAVAVFLKFPVNGNLAPRTIVNIVIAMFFKLRPVQDLLPEFHRCLIRQQHPKQRRIIGRHDLFFLGFFQCCRHIFTSLLASAQREVFLFHNLSSPGNYVMKAVFGDIFRLVDTKNVGIGCKISHLSV